MKSLVFITPKLSLSGKVAVVASSAKLKEWNCGGEIDSYEEVIRFNRAPLEGYEKWVGSKTTLRVVNNHVFANKELDSKVWTNQPKDFVRNLRDTRIVYFGPDYSPWNNKEKNTHKSCKLFLFNYRRQHEMKAYLDFREPKNLSVGLGIIAVLLMSEIKPSLYGFDVEQSDSYARSHYWEDRPPQGDFHSVSSEAGCILKLAEQGKVDLFL